MAPTVLRRQCRSRCAAGRGVLQAKGAPRNIRYNWNVGTDQRIEFQIFSTNCFCKLSARAFPGNGTRVFLDAQPGRRSAL
jgi:hypothetical protein